MFLIFLSFSSLSLTEVAHVFFTCFKQVVSVLACARVIKWRRLWTEVGFWNVSWFCYVMVASMPWIFWNPWKTLDCTWPFEKILKTLEKQTSVVTVKMLNPNPWNSWKFDFDFMIHVYNLQTNIIPFCRFSIGYSFILFQTQFCWLILLSRSCRSQYLDLLETFR